MTLPLGSRNRNQGFSLIEVIIAMFILVVGLLGLAGLQLAVTQGNHDSYIRSQAMVLTQSLADRMRLNSQYLNRTANTSPVLNAATDNRYSASSSYNFDGLGSCSGQPWDCFCQATPSAIPRCGDNNGTDASVCSAEQLALFDGWQASCDGAALHPDFWIQVTCQDADGTDGDACSAHSTHLITASWPASEALEAARVSCPTDIDLGLAAAGTENVDRHCVLLSVTFGGSR
ncbi:type IV pilus modification protein PilV [Neiella marina]|uniref:Type IV pilus modification protein PilV n=1 Tax=Neiella holothuriorum TaxID=2870530 RepID=A0ABS7EHR4_9GAMM|nr:type IV pilus modification protein PilV [Neiella holothuriorum]MBW8191881.1 type IV pilus modification protein PilV [Neiella holothuriorum]